MAQSQTFSIRNIVKKEALPRIIFSSFYIYMHVDGGELVMRADSWVVWWESARKLSRSAHTKCVRRYGWTMPSLKVNLLFVWCLRDIVFAGFSSVLTALWPIASLSVYTTHSLAHFLTHSFIHSFILSLVYSNIHWMPINEGLQRGRSGESRKVS